MAHIASFLLILASVSYAAIVMTSVAARAESCTTTCQTIGTTQFCNTRCY